MMNVRTCLSALCGKDSEPENQRKCQKTSKCTLQQKSTVTALFFLFINLWLSPYRPDIPAGWSCVRYVPRDYSFTGQAHLSPLRRSIHNHRQLYSRFNKRSGGALTEKTGSLCGSNLQIWHHLLCFVTDSSVPKGHDLLWPIEISIKSWISDLIEQFSLLMSSVVHHMLLNAEWYTPGFAFKPVSRFRSGVTVQIGR